MLSNFSGVIVRLTHCGQVTPCGGIYMGRYGIKSSPKTKLAYHQIILIKLRAISFCLDVNHYKVFDNDIFENTATSPRRQ